MIVILPWRGGSLTKSRLAPLLNERERIALSAAMLGHVAATVRAATDAPLWVVTPEPAPVACDRWIGDGGQGMNAAVSLAFSYAGSRSVLVLPADLPRLRATTVARLIERMAGGSVVIAPDADRIGTNALGLPRADALAPRFGDDSFTAHLDGAHRAGLHVDVFEADDLSFDLDRPAQFARLDPQWKRHVRAA